MSAKPKTPRPETTCAEVTRQNHSAASGVVQSVRVADKCAEEGTQFEELIPVLATAGQPRYLDAEDQTDMIQGDFTQETPETSQRTRRRFLGRRE